MQTNCPQCAHRIVVDDARVPDRPFAVRCPKCQAAVRFPGRGASAAPAAPATAPARTAPAAPAPDAAEPSGGDAAPPPALGPGSVAQLRREVGGDTRGRQVLLALPDRNVAGALTLPLTRLGYSIEVLDRPEEGGRMLEDGAFDVVITTRTAGVPGRNETLWQRVTRLSPDARRRIFLIVVGDEFRTGEGTQAWAVQADLVVNPRDAGGVESPLLSALAERTRLFQPYLDARRRHELAET